MLKFMRNKLVSIEKRDPENLVAHGILDDDMYRLALDVTLRISDLEILSIDGRWNRWTTPECPRAIAPLQEAVGFSMKEEGFSQKVHRVIGRKACRHFANLLLECCHTAREAIELIKREEKEDLGIPLETSSGSDKEESSSPEVASPVSSSESLTKWKKIPDKKVREKGGNFTIIDLHVHSSPASPCSSAPVEALIVEAKRIGLDGICLTDHNYTWSPDHVEELREKHGFLILRGNEIITDQGDMLVFGLDKDTRGIVALQELKEEVRRAGGYIIVPHPFRGFLTFGVGQLGLTPEKAMERPLFKWVDAIEVLNSKVTEKENAFAAKVAKGLGLPATGGSDAHEVSEVGIYGTQFSSVIHDEQDLIEALKNGDFSPVAYRKRED